MMSLCLAPAIEANSNDIIERDGIYFKHMAQVAMEDSAWTVVTDIDLSQIDKTIDQISDDEIKRANKTQQDVYSGTVADLQERRNRPKKVEKASSSATMRTYWTLLA